MLAACETSRVSSGVARPTPAVPHDPPDVPADAEVNRMAFMVGSKPLDTDGNGFPDRIEATVTLFAAPYPTPLWSDGRLVVGMYLKGQARDGEHPPVVEWAFEGDEFARARAMSRVGRQYRLSLSLYDTGTDRFPFGEVDLVCRFEPADGGAPVLCEGVRSIQIGRRSAG